jgi:serine/threonine-protein kinase RsbT
VLAILRKRLQFALRSTRDPLSSGRGEAVVIGEKTRVAIQSDGDVVLARQKARELAAGLGFSGTELTLLATAVSEVARNIVVYAECGEIFLHLVAEGRRQGIRVVARDSGPGIPDIDQAKRDGFSTGKSLGLGLPGAERLMDDFDIQSTVGVGTTITMTKWART